MTGAKGSPDVSSDARGAANNIRDELSQQTIGGKVEEGREAIEQIVWFMPTTDPAGGSKC